MRGMAGSSPPRVLALLSHLPPPQPPHHELLGTINVGMAVAAQSDRSAV